MLARWAGSSSVTEMLACRTKDLSFIARTHCQVGESWGRHRLTPAAYWLTGLAYLMSSRLVRDLVLKTKEPEEQHLRLTSSLHVCMCTLCKTTTHTHK